ncbi:WbqC family protein [Streptomyces sp. NPDC046712]|uniref:WbqC family protein n=1 Tax=Streptomyces sp. NPDC046712 TaxID=3154802 RepID=UPI0033ECA8F4
MCVPRTKSSSAPASPAGSSAGEAASGGLVAIHQPNLFPRLSTLAKIFAADCWIVLDDVQFARRDFQHRARLGSMSNPARHQWLSMRRTRGQFEPRSTGTEWGPELGTSAGCTHFRESAIHTGESIGGNVGGGAARALWRKRVGSASLKARASWGPVGDHTVSATLNGAGVDARSAPVLSLLYPENTPDPHIWGSRGRRFKSCRPDFSKSQFKGPFQRNLKRPLDRFWGPVAVKATWSPTPGSASAAPG